MQVRCPTCGKMHEYRTSDRFRPFCSERCKMIDLGRWAAGDYVIPGKPGDASPEDLMEELARRAEAAAAAPERKRRR